MERGLRRPRYNGICYGSFYLTAAEPSTLTRERTACSSRLSNLAFGCGVVACLLAAIRYSGGYLVICCPS